MSSIKLDGELLINGKPYEYSNEDIKVYFTQAGRASFNVVSDEILKGIVSFSFALAGKTKEVFFTGFIASCEQSKQGEVVILCYHLAALLKHPLNLSIRHASLKQVLDAITKKTGLNFKVQEGPHNDFTAAGFYSVGNGHQCLDCIGPIFGFDNYYWMQNPSGEIELGNYQNSKYAANPLEIPAGFIRNIHSTQQGEIVPIPAMLPGVLIAERGIVKTVQLIKNRMVITWSKQLKA